MNKLAAAAVALSLTGAGAAEAQDIEITRNGSQPTRAGVASQFTGHVLVDALTTRESAKFAGSGLVTFAPGARTNWHTHPAGQWLLVASGQGWIQKDGQARQEMKAGDAVWIPAGVKHWHGATDQTAMSHVAVTPVYEGQNVTWLEAVSDAQYASN